MSSLSRAWLLVLGIAAFIAAAKSHGRQLRLERQLAGYINVTFGGENPPFVEALWRRDRYRYWAVVVALLVAGLVLKPLGQTSLTDGILFYGVLPMSGAFISLGLASLVRWGVEAKAHAQPLPSSTELAAAAWGSAGWFALAISLVTTLAFLAWPKPS